MEGKVQDKFGEEQWVKVVKKNMSVMLKNVPVAMTALMVICPLLLQKPTRKSKAKDHDRFLESRLHHFALIIDHV